MSMPSRTSARWATSWYERAGADHRSSRSLPTASISWSGAEQTSEAVDRQRTRRSLTEPSLPVARMLSALSPIASSRRLLQLSGPSYVVVAFLGRIPLAMSQMGILLLVSDTTGRYGYGGLAAGAFAIANAIGAPVAGAIADRIGQRPVVLVQSTASGLGLVALVATTTAQAPIPAIVGLAVLAGLACPQVGPLARVRWRPITRPAGDEQARLVDAAFSYEGAADEASFVLGPTLVGLVGVLISPAGAIVVAAVMLVVFGGWFALHPTAELTTSARGAPVGGTARLFSLNFAVLLMAQLLIGTLFGATQTGTTL